MNRTEVPISTQIVEAVATQTNRDPLELPLLYDTIDPDALDDILPTLTDGDVRFQYAGVSVLVDSQGTIEIITPRPDAPDSMTEAK